MIDNLAIAQIYGEAKSNQDVERALSVCSDDFYIDAPSFGIRANSKMEARRQLGFFFQAFPDFKGHIGEEFETGSRETIAIGTISCTFADDFFGIEATGKVFGYPFVSLFEFREHQLVGERFFFDVSVVAAGMGVPEDLLRESLVETNSLGQPEG